VLAGEDLTDFSVYALESEKAYLLILRVDVGICLNYYDFLNFQNWTLLLPKCMVWRKSVKKATPSVFRK
jgi:hypothetical protein